MKYFTKEWFKEMQVRGFLVFPETLEDWEADLAWYEAEEWNISEIRREDLDNRKNDLLKFLPEGFHPYILDGTINAQFPSEELREMALQWRNEYDARMKVLNQAYRNSYHAIKGSLPKDVVQWYEKTLHDSKLLSFDRPSRDTFVIILDCLNYYSGEVKFTFEGVRELSFPDTLIGSYWVTGEIYANEAGFELHVLLEGPLSELTLVAANVSIVEL